MINNNKHPFAHAYSADELLNLFVADYKGLYVLCSFGSNLVPIADNVFPVSSQARLSHRFPTLPGKIDSRLILRQIGYDVLKLEYYGRRMLNSDTQRVSPGGDMD
ncbi:hypothetical protein JRO89_XS15G0096000 [Xanthoceras sorbifolium]|uniref:Uncharacterized protein n=1 Tax=Xanthoceras sorbifolium TaxID=99658 RepID=A0ABQ8H1G8_9ROSI|nr:hypothetical protein JRO89_XS15G0096000 [Xanthoceras sorbifolium]